MCCIEDKLELAALLLQFNGNKNFEFVHFLKKVLEGASIGCFRELFGDSTVLVEEMTDGSNGCVCRNWNISDSVFRLLVLYFGKTWILEILMLLSFSL